MTPLANILVGIGVVLVSGLLYSCFQESVRFTYGVSICEK